MDGKLLSGKVAVVTGGGRGIGKAIAGALAAQGAHVVVAARTSAEIEKAASTIRAAGGSATPVQADITDERQVGQLIGESLKLTGSVDILVNNAGIGVFKPVV